MDKKKIAFKFAHQNNLFIIGFENFSQNDSHFKLFFNTHLFSIVSS